MTGGKRKLFLSVFFGRVLLLVCFLTGFFLIWPQTANAGSVIFSPATGNYNVGNTFSVGVYVSTPEEAMNAVQAVVKFSKDKLEVVSISKSGSIISLWIQEPSFSNNLGTINFEGIVLNPGFIGRSGKILSINFRAKAAGQGVLSLSNGSLLANDGQGTDILSGLGTASFNLTPSQIKPEEAEPEIAEEAQAAETTIKGTLPAPKITSPNVPDSNKWYNMNDPRFEWQIPRGTTGVSFVSDHNSFSVPGTKSDGLMSFYQYQEVKEDGVWYFHLRLRNSAGWSVAGHYRYQIDRTAPKDLSINFPAGKESDNPAPRIIFKATDDTSGVDFYQITVDNGEPIKVVGSEYTLPAQGLGEHKVLVQAIDKAGNIASVTESFTIKALNPPEFTEYSKELNKGDLMVIKGKSYPQAQVTVWLQHDEDGIESQTINSGTWGDFTFVYRDRAKAGIYKVWADVIDQRGLRSGPSKTITIAVQQSAFWKVTGIIFNYLVVLVPLLGLLLLMLILLLYLWRKLIVIKKALRKEVHEVEDVVCHAFTDLRNNIEDQLDLLEKTKKKRKLTREEAVVAAGLAKSLLETKKAGKKLRHLEDEVK